MGKPQKRNDIVMRLAVDLYKKLGSGHAVAARLDMAPTTTYRLLRDAGVHIPGWRDAKPNRQKFSPEVSASVVADYLAGMSLANLESKYGSGQYAIRAAVKRAGHPLRDHGAQRRRVTQSEVDQIVAMYTQDGLSQAQIAVAIGAGQTVISKVLRERGVPSRFTRRGAGAIGWRGGISKTAGGYVLEYCADDPVFRVMATRSGYAMQHRLVMAKHLQRPLLHNETVHHINGDKTDNRIENLQLRHGKHGCGEVLVCAACGSRNIVHERLTEQ